MKSHRARHEFMPILGSIESDVFAPRSEVLQLDVMDWTVRSIDVSSKSIALHSTTMQALQHSNCIARGTDRLYLSIQSLLRLSIDASSTFGRGEDHPSLLRRTFLGPQHCRIMTVTKFLASINHQQTRSLQRSGTAQAVRSHRSSLLKSIR